MNRELDEKLNYIFLTCFVSFLMITDILSLSWAQGIIKSIGAAIFMLWGIFNIVYMIAVRKIRYKGYTILLIFFIFIAVLSTIINVSYGWIDNIKALVWMSIHYLLLFNINLHVDDVDKSKKYFLINKIFLIPSLIWNCAIIYSLYQLFHHTYYEIERLGQGFNNGRLYGVFHDPNYASIATCCMLFIGIICIKKGKYKRIYKFSVVLNAIYIMMCGSRGGWISFFIGILIYQILCSSFSRDKLVFNRNRFFKGLSKGILIMGILFLVRGGFLFAAEYTYDEKIETNPSITSTQVTTDVEFSRVDLEGHTLTNGRFDIWKSAVSIAMDHPILGLSPRNLNRYTDIHYPNSYIGITGQNAHNGYIGVLVGTGLSGLLIMLLFFLLSYYKIFFSVYMREENYYMICSMIGMSITCMAGMIFIQDILIFNSISTVLFWVFLGNLTKSATVK